jgi:hypothetical protein
MKPDENRGSKPFFSMTDLNGSYYIDVEKANDRHTESDYVFVHFYLHAPELYITDEIFVTGEFYDWEHNEKNRMKYNGEEGLFECTLLLKQGLYDYCFVKADAVTGNITAYELEGNFYETENDYAIYIYFHDHFKRFDRLMGYLPIK